MRVLDAGLALFAARGIDGVNVHDLARVSKTSVGSIYHHFGDRRGVVVAMYRRAMESLLHDVTRAVLRERSARRGIHALVRAYLRWMARHPVESRLIFVAGQTDLEPTSDIVAWKRELTAPLFAWLAPFVGRTVKRLPPEYYEIVIIGPLAELVARSIGRRLDVDGATRVLAGSIWRSLAIS